MKSLLQEAENDSKSSKKSHAEKLSKKRKRNPESEIGRS
jgi:hypothetical protein